MSHKKKQRYSISVSSRTYDRLRLAVNDRSLAGFVEDILDAALDDPTILARLLDRCHSQAEAAA